MTWITKIRAELYRDRVLLFRAAVIVLPTLVLVSWAAGRITVNPTESVPGTFFWQVPNAEIQPGSYVMIPAVGPQKSEHIRHFVKMAVCLPGDTLVKDDFDFFCNDKLIARAKKTSRSGQPLNSFQWSRGLVPEGMFFAGSTHPDAFDSRYFGLVAIVDAVPLELIK